MSEQLHIVYLTQWYPHPEDVQNGIFIKHQAAGLAKHHKVTVLWVGASKATKRMAVSVESSQDGKLREVRVRYPKSKKALGKAAAWKKALEYAEKVDVVHLNILDRDHPIWELWLLKRRIPYIIHEHASLYFKTYKKDAFWHKSRKRLIKGAFRVCPVSDGLKEAMLNKGLNGRYVVTPNILKTPESRQRKPKQGKLMLVSIGDLVNNVKRFDSVISELLKLNEPWEYHIIGDGPDRKELEKHAERLSKSSTLGTVVLKGRLTQNQVQEELPKYHVCIVNSAYETFGLVALEALNAGVPVVSTDVGVVRQYLADGRNGRVVKNDDEIANAVIKIWSKYDSLDSELLTAEQKNRLSTKQFRKRVHELYRQLGLFVD